MSEDLSIDRSAIDHVISVGGQDLLQHLAGLFFEMAPARIAAASRALEGNDLEGVYRELHALRSGAGNLGAGKLTRTSTAIEMQAKAGQSDGMDSMLEVLQFQFEQARAALEEIIQDAGEDEGRTDSTSDSTESQRTIAVVEDNPDNRLLVRTMLEDKYSIVEFENGKDAMEGLESHPVDLILMDISLPEMDGVDILEFIRSRPSLQRVPVIALTAYAMDGDRERFLDAGFDEYIPKPVEEDTLSDVITSLLG